MPRWLEFHDSDLIEIVSGDDLVAVRLRAYIHEWQQSESGWSGTGWIQPVEIFLRGNPSASASVTGEIWNGTLKLGDDELLHLVPIPFIADRPTHLQIELTSGAVVEVHAARVSVDSCGAPTFVENLPNDMRPDAG